MQPLPPDLQKKIDQLDRYDDAYYNDQAIINDEDYDLFKDSVYRHLPPDHPRLAKVGHPVSDAWPKAKHLIMMGSQNKVCTEDAIREYISKIERDSGKKGSLSYVLEYKVDGFSLELQYKNGKLSCAATRGNGSVGENITPNAKLFRQVPQILPIKKDIVIRSEGVIYDEDFESIQKKSGNKYKNARNAASGISRRFDGEFCKYIRAIAYDINAKVLYEHEKIDALKKLGFTTVESFQCSSIDEVLKIYRQIRDKVRDTLPYGIDGLVLKVDEVNTQEKLGIQNNRPEGQIALKFEAEAAVTSVIDILLQVGRTGKITPIALLEDVDLMGSTIRKASIHNFKYIMENGIGVGAEVKIEKKGDIIPQITEVLMQGDTYTMPEKCPSCGSKLEFDGTNLWCRAKVCKERDIARMTYWMETLDIKGFSDKFLVRLWDIGKVRRVSDIYELGPDDFASIDGIGEKTVKNFMQALKDTSVMLLERFIVALGVPTCSKSTSKILVENFKTWDKIAGITPQDLQKLPGFAETSSVSVVEGLREIDSMARDLLKVIKIKEPKKGSLTGMSFCVTGSLESMGRKEFQEFVVENGGIAKDTVGEGLTYLVSNDTSSGSSKNQKAKKLGIKVIDEKEFFKIAGHGIEDKIEKDAKKEDVKIVPMNLFD